MIRRWIGLLLTTALTGAGSTMVPSSDGLGGQADRGIEPAGSSLVDLDKGYTDCAEILASRNPLILRDGKVVLLQPGMTSGDLMKVLQDARPMFGNPDDNVLYDLVSSGRVRFDSPKIWPSLPAGELLPEGNKPADLVGAPCGIPSNVTRLIPVSHEPGLGRTA
jgi:hypothetical protein